MDRGGDLIGQAKADAVPLARHQAHDLTEHVRDVALKVALGADRIMLQHDLLIGAIAALAFDVAVELLHRNDRNPIEVAPLLGPAQLIAAMARATRAIELTGRNDFLGDVCAPDDHRGLPLHAGGSNAHMSATLLQSSIW